MLACGFGRPSLELARRGYDVTGVDITPAYIEYAAAQAQAENLKIFRVVSKALKPGGKHFMDIMNGSYAGSHLPCKLWDAGEKCFTLSNFEWNTEKKTLIYGQSDYPYGETLYKPDMQEGNPIRLYMPEEIEAVFAKLVPKNNKAVSFVFRESRSTEK